jgi:uncharacterized membrane protein YdbT with pleckstrin-like domain
MENLHPGAKWLFRIGGLLPLIFILIFVFVGFLRNSSESGSNYLIWFIPFSLFFILIVEIVVRLQYKYWKYEFATDSLKIEKGIIIKKYKSIPYERIQNVDLTRGIIARIIGFSTIDIQTAGYSGHHNKGGYNSEGHIPAVSTEKAEKIREFLMKKITGKKSGL